MSVQEHELESQAGFHHVGGVHLEIGGVPGLQERLVLFLFLVGLQNLLFGYVEVDLEVELSLDVGDCLG